MRFALLFAVLFLSHGTALAQRKCADGASRDLTGKCPPAIPRTKKPPKTAPRKGCLREFRADTVFSGDTIIDCAKIVFFDGVTVRITGGHRLTLKAKTILVNGTATIDGKGDDGQGGAAGDSIQGQWKSQGEDDYNSALSDCRSNVNHFDRGKSGGPGGPGGPGATIVLGSKPKGTLTVLVDGGPGGPGGPGGSGRLLLRGDNPNCNGCTMNCPAGPEGPQGDKGPKGSVIVR